MISFNKLEFNKLCTKSSMDLKVFSNGEFKALLTGTYLHLSLFFQLHYSHLLGQPSVVSMIE